MHAPWSAEPRARCGDREASWSAVALYRPFLKTRRHTGVASRTFELLVGLKRQRTGAVVRLRVALIKAVEVRLREQFIAR